MSYPDKYHDLLDAQVWQYIRDTEAWYPPDAVDLSIKEQRSVYDRMCRAFHHGIPDGVTSRDEHIGAASASHSVPIRRYQSAHATNRAVILYFHGGGFVVGGLETHDDICAEICHSTGCEVISVDYRLAPENTFPDDFNDAQTVFQHVTDQTTVPIITVGDSAGGNIAAALGHWSRDQPRPPIAQVLIYPGLSSELTGGSFDEHRLAPGLTTADTVFYKSLRCGGDEEILRQKHCSPLNDPDFSGLPLTTVFTAQCDPLRDNGRGYCDRVNRAGGKARYFEEAGLIHGYLRARHQVDKAAQSFERIINAINESCKA